jgi:hypothetical protein
MLVALVAMVSRAQSIDPEVSSWVLNSGGETGYRGIPSNVQQVRYSADNVYVSCTCIPGYDIGPWAGNPNTPANQNFVFKITRTPQPNAGAKIATPLGHIGVWSNGVSVFNARDARSYNNANIWHQNAIVVEGPSFDTCLGHPAPNGEYHHHLNPRCLYDDRDSGTHSPIIGYAFDGYPIYGAYGFRNADGTGGITRMRSGYRTRTMTDRSTLADGTILQSSQHGPDVNDRYPLGYYTEDYEYIAGSGDLDEHNGRQCVTPEYPEGTYAYFVTLDASGAAAYPYTLGETYYGTVPAGNTGPQSGHNTPTEPVTTYTPASAPRESDRIVADVAPNPASDRITLTCDAPRWGYTLHDLLGRAITSGESTARQTTIDVGALGSGVYTVRVESADGVGAVRVVVRR